MKLEVGNDNKFGPVMGEFNKILLANINITHINIKLGYNLN